MNLPDLFKITMKCPACDATCRIPLMKINRRGMCSFCGAVFTADPEMQQDMRIVVVGCAKTGQMFHFIYHRDGDPYGRYSLQKLVEEKVGGGGQTNVIVKRSGGGLKWADFTQLTSCPGCGETLGLSHDPGCGLLFCTSNMIRETSEARCPGCGHIGRYIRECAGPLATKYEGRPQLAGKPAVNPRQLPAPSQAIVVRSAVIETGIVLHRTNGGLQRR